MELGGSRGLEELAARGATAHLERELGLGSLERVELMVRLGNACGVRLPDRVVAEAETVQDLVDALLHEELRRQRRCSDRSNRPAPADATAVISRSPTRRNRGSRRQNSLRRIVDGNLRLRGVGEPGAGTHPFIWRERAAAYDHVRRALQPRFKGGAELRRGASNPVKR